MSFPPAVVQAARELASPSMLAAVSKFERKARADRSFGLVVTQMIQSSIAASLVSRALEALGRNSLTSFHTKVALFIAPALYVIEQQLPLGKVKTAARFLQRNLGTLVYAAAFISQVALAYLTGSGVAIAAVGILAFDCLHTATASLLPARVSQGYSLIQLSVVIASQLLMRATLAKIALFIATVLAQKLILSKFALPRDPQKNLGVLTPGFLDTILKSDDPSALFEINLNHLNWIKARPTPNLHLDEFLTEWDRINWAQQLPALRKTIRFAPPANLRGCLVQTIAHLKSPDPTWAKVREREAKIVLEAIQKEPSEERRAKILFKVALYGAGSLADLHDCFLFNVNSKTPLRDEILVSARAAQIPVDRELYGAAAKLGLGDLLREMGQSFFSYTVQSSLWRTKLLPGSREKARSWWKSFLAQKDRQTRAQFQALLSRAIDRESRANWNCGMDLSAEYSITMTEQQILKSERALPTNISLDIQGLDLAKTAPRRSHNLLHASPSEFQIDVSDALLLAMLFEMGIIQPKTAELNPHPAPARQPPTLSQRLVARLRRVANPAAQPPAPVAAAR